MQPERDVFDVLDDYAGSAQPIRRSRFHDERDVNLHELKARNRKSEAMAAVLLATHITSAQAWRMNRVQWATVAAAAGVHPPAKGKPWRDAQATRFTTINILRGLEGESK